MGDMPDMPDITEIVIFFKVVEMFELAKRVVIA